MTALWPLVAAVFSASVLGSLHCAGMCGAFVAFAVALDAPTPARRRAQLQAAYHAGRLLVYVTMGSIAGALGGAFDLAGEAVGVQRAAVGVAGAAMMIFGVLAILRLNGVRVPRAPVPTALREGATRAMRFAMDRPPIVRAALTGLCTTLLPCGWLYAFVLTASGAADPLIGAVIMVVFWAGTLPVLVAIGSGLQAVLARAGGWGRRIPVISATLIVLVGLWATFDRGRLDPALLAVGATADGSSLVDHVRTLQSADAPCCHDQRAD